MNSEVKLLNTLIRSEKDLKDYLEGYGIETYSWGRGSNSSIESLFREISSNDVELFLENNTIKRKVHNVVVFILYELQSDYGNLLLQLKEVVRIKKNEEGKFASDRMLRRRFRGSIAKKIRGDDDTEKLAYQTIKEKMNIDLPRGLENKRSYTQNDNTAATSYPGLKTVYITTEYDFYLPKIYFKPNGYCYQSEQENSLTVLEWTIV